MKQISTKFYYRLSFDWDLIFSLCGTSWTLQLFLLPMPKRIGLQLWMTMDAMCLLYNIHITRTVIEAFKVKIWLLSKNTKSSLSNKTPLAKRDSSLHEMIQLGKVMYNFVFQNWNLPCFLLHIPGRFKSYLNFFKFLFINAIIYIVKKRHWFP